MRSTSTHGIIFLANPNNPTGTMIDAATVDQVHRGSSRACGRGSRRGLLRVCVVFCGADAELSIRTPCNIYGRARPWSCCEHFRRRMDWPGCAWDTVLGRQNCSLLRADAEYVFSFVDGAGRGAGGDRTIRSTSSASFRTTRTRRRCGSRAFGVGFPCSADVGEFSLLRSRRRFRGVTERLRSERVSVRPLGDGARPRASRQHWDGVSKMRAFLHAMRRIATRARFARPADRKEQARIASL